MALVAAMGAVIFVAINMFQESTPVEVKFAKDLTHRAPREDSNNMNGPDREILRGVRVTSVGTASYDEVVLAKKTDPIFTPRSNGDHDTDVVTLDRIKNVRHIDVASIDHAHFIAESRALFFNAISNDRVYPDESFGKFGDGVYMRKYKNQLPKYRTYCSQGAAHGLQETYSEDGKLEAERFLYKGICIHGITYIEAITIDAAFRDDKHHGRMSSYSSGKKMEEYLCENGVTVEFKKYRNNGSLEYHKYYDSSNKLLTRKEYFDVLGKMIKIEFFNENGKVEKTVTVDGVPEAGGN